MQSKLLFSSYSNEKPLFPSQEVHVIKLCLTHLEVWAGCIGREEELLQVGGMNVCALMLLPGKGLGCSRIWFQPTETVWQELGWF